MDLVTEKAGKPVTNSLKVAEVFEKQHKNILRDIINIRSTLKSIGEPQLNFEPTTYFTQGREYPMFEMDRDAFALLVFGFNGKKALKLRVDFIKAFNNMELELQKTKAKLIDPSDIPLALETLATILRNNENTTEAAEVLESLPVQKAERPLLFPEVRAKPSINYHKRSTRYVLGKLGLMPYKTAAWFENQGYLIKDDMGWQSRHPMRVPTEKGKRFFATVSAGLYFTEEGFAWINRLINTGVLPRKLYQKQAA